MQKFGRFLSAAVMALGAAISPVIYQNVYAETGKDEVLPANQLDYRLIPQEIDLMQDRVKVDFWSLGTGYYPEKIVIVYPKYDFGGTAETMRQRLGEIKNGGLDDWTSLANISINIPEENWLVREKITVDIWAALNGNNLKKNLEQSLFYAVKFSKLVSDGSGVHFVEDGSHYLSGEWDYSACGNSDAQFASVGNAICQTFSNTSSQEIEFAWRDAPMLVDERDELISKLQTEIQKLNERNTFLMQENERALEEMILVEQELARVQDELMRLQGEHLKLFDSSQKIEQLIEQIERLRENNLYSQQNRENIMTEKVYTNTIERILAPEAIIHQIPASEIPVRKIEEELANLTRSMDELKTALGSDNSAVEVPALGGVEEDNSGYWIIINILILIGSILGWLMYFWRGFKNREERRKNT